jgi:hypothetical protein
MLRKGSMKRPLVDLFFFDVTMMRAHTGMLTSRKSSATARKIRWHLSSQKRCVVARRVPIVLLVNS